MVELKKEELEKIKEVLEAHIDLINTLIDDYLLREGASSKDICQASLLVAEKSKINNIILNLSGGEK